MKLLTDMINTDFGAEFLLGAAYKLSGQVKWKPFYERRIKSAAPVTVQEEDQLLEAELVDQVRVGGTRLHIKFSRLLQIAVLVDEAAR